MEEKRALVYPYTDEFTPLFRYWKGFGKYNITHLVLPAGFGLTGKDAAEADLSSPLGKLIEDDFEAALADVDTVIIADPGGYFVTKREGPWDGTQTLPRAVIAKMKLAMERGKDIVCLMEFQDEMEEDLRKAAIELQVTISFLGDMEDKVFLKRVLQKKDKAPKKIPIPVIFVMGMGENTDKYLVQLGLRQRLAELGLNVGWVGSRRYTELLGGHSLPSFLNDLRYTEVQKIELFNHFVHEVAQEGAKDVVIVGVPGGVLPYNRQIHNQYGRTAYLMTQAVIPDYTVFTAYCFEKIEEWVLQGMVDAVKFRCNSGLDAVHVSRFDMDMNKTQELKVVHYHRYAQGAVDTLVQAYRTFFPNTFNVHHDDELRRLLDAVVEELSGDTHAEVMNERGAMEHV